MQTIPTTMALYSKLFPGGPQTAHVHVIEDMVKLSNVHGQVGFINLIENRLSDVQEWLDTLWLHHQTSDEFQDVIENIALYCRARRAKGETMTGNDMMQEVVGLFVAGLDDEDYKLIHVHPRRRWEPKRDDKMEELIARLEAEAHGA